MFNFSSFSFKQLLLLSWWCPNSILASHDAIICDGSVRSGKSLCMSLSFVLWAFFSFPSPSFFSFCGKSVSSVSRNVIFPLINILSSIGFSCHLKSSKNLLVISYNELSHSFYLFGGKDESSASLIQGVTLAGVMFDEVVLMPRSFVEQAIARCSLDNSKFWFNCNPDSPSHWFYSEWILKASVKNTLYIHFLMSDNPSLSPAIVKRYSALYSGTFYKRFVLGQWASNSGLVYPMFNPASHVVHSLPRSFSKFFISCDYGIVNPASFGLWGLYDNTWFRIREFFFNSKLNNQCLTDYQYLQHLIELAGKFPISSIIVDPSASSFIQTIRLHSSFHVTPAKNDVISGINLVANALNSRSILFHSSCIDSIREFSLYSWDYKSNFDSVKKLNDHSMDDIRYFVSHISYSTPKTSNLDFAYSLPR